MSLRNILRKWNMDASLNEMKIYKALGKYADSQLGIYII